MCAARSCGGHPILSKINLHIKAGETIAIVGATGAGKSTLVSLVPRFFDPTNGQVDLDGEDIRNYQLQSLREHISLVLQDSLLFKGTIRENIAFGRPGATLDEIAAAAVKAAIARSLDSVHKRLGHGLDLIL